MPHPEDLPRASVKEVRTGKMAQFGSVQSGIDKQCRGSTFVSFLGLTDDEHDPTFHGGIDKALHQYCSDHYSMWQDMYPSATGFVNGGFGENIVASNLSESTICIGDTVQIGDCLLEVSLPRQPCFKLNQRFNIKNFAPRTHQLAMTGWYYRVKQEGYIEPGMDVVVIKRPYPQWSISRIHEYVHREKKYLPEMQELINMPELGNECKDIFIDRFEKTKAKPAPRWRNFDLTSKHMETAHTARLSLKADITGGNSRIPPGSSVTIKLPNGLQRAYSVVDGDTDCFTLGVRLDDNSRGGSAYIHQSLHVGDAINVGPFVRNLKPNGMASHYIFIVGGIGITAFLGMMSTLHAINCTFELHYCVRSMSDAAFTEGLRCVTYHDKSKGQRLDIKKVLQDRAWNSHVFTCGPTRMIDEVAAIAKELGMADDEVHYELFAADTTGDPFTAQVTCGDQRHEISIADKQSLLEVMRNAGLEVQSSCETGSCGTCRIPYQGRVEHRGTALNAAEQQTEMLSCVSRGIGHIMVDISA